MKLNRSTWLALIALAALIAVAISNMQEKLAVVEIAKSFPTLDTHSVFSMDAGDPIHIQIVSAAGGTVELAINMQHAWDVSLPIEGAADQGAVAAALSQIGALRSVGQVEPIPLSDLGLEHPAYTLTLGYTGGTQHTLEIGDMAPSAVGYYARLDQDKLMIVDTAGIESLLTLLTSPPYLQTPTPSALPATPTPVPAQGTLVPAESVTPAS